MTRPSVPRHGATSGFFGSGELVNTLARQNSRFVARYTQTARLLTPRRRADYGRCDEADPGGDQDHARPSAPHRQTADVQQRRATRCRRNSTAPTIQVASTMSASGRHQSTPCWMSAVPPSTAAAKHTKGGLPLRHSQLTRRRRAEARRRPRRRRLHAAVPRLMPPAQCRLRPPAAIKIVGVTIASALLCDAFGWRVWRQ